MSREKTIKKERGILITLFGGVVFAFGIYLTTLFIPANVINDMQLDLSNKKIRGLLVDYVETNSSINDEEVIEFIYEYEIHNSERITSSSYSTGGYLLEIGDSLHIEMSPSNYYLTRIEGMYTTELGYYSFASFLFPALGLGIIFVGAFQFYESRTIE